MSQNYNVKGVRASVKPVTSQFQFGPWTLTTIKSHILESEGAAREKYYICDPSPKGTMWEVRFEGQLELPQVPEMIFADNVLRLQHEEGYGIEFNALDSLKLVDAHHDRLKVAVSEAWKEARSNCEHINEVVKPFDWTFSTDYKGTLLEKYGKEMKVEETEEKIDIEKLKVREKIHFYEDILLFEDELSDNGSSILNVKVRVMPTSFFILLRQFMRVDNVIVRISDTRIYHEAGKNYILREHTTKEDKTQDIKAPPFLVTNPNEIDKYLTLRKSSYEKLVFPDKNSLEQTNSDDAVR